MHYDGPSFYKGRETSEREQNSPEKQTPLDRLKQEEKRSSQLTKDFKRKQQLKSETRPGNHLFRSTQIPKSLQKRAGWKKETWNQSLVDELQKRLKKETEDYLLFSDNMAEELAEELEDKVEAKPKKPTKTTMEQPEEISAEAKRIKDMVAEIESTLDTAALVQKEMKPDLTKPDTGLHRTLSTIIADDQNSMENGKNNLNSLFSPKRKK